MTRFNKSNAVSVAHCASSGPCLHRAESPAAPFTQDTKLKDRKNCDRPVDSAFSLQNPSRQLTIQCSYLLKLWKGRNTGRELSVPNYPATASIFQRNFGCPSKCAPHHDLVHISPASSWPQSCSERSRCVPVGAGRFQREGHTQSHTGRPLTRCLKCAPELLDEVADTKMYS